MSISLHKVFSLACMLIFISSCGGGSSNISSDQPVKDTPPPTACTAGARPQWSESPLSWQQVFGGVSFSFATGLYQEPGNNGSWYVIEKAGQIYRFSNFDAVASRTLILDIHDSHVNSNFEGGLLGMAFDPDFANNGYVYLSYTSNDTPSDDSGAGTNFHSVISRVKFSADRTGIDMTTEKIILTLPQPAVNHNGGNIAFDKNGYFYIGFGDGGATSATSQDTTNLYGAILRIDVTGVAETATNILYTIPADNPFSANPLCSTGSGSAACPEIYAWGFRNPWRWSFDRLSGDLWLADVGESAWEEVDRVEIGNNYGWPCYEGQHIYNQSICNSNTTYTPPITDYPHDPGAYQNSVTGGYIYRGAAIPTLQGTYIFGDYVNGKIWSLADYQSSPTVQLIEDLPIYLSSFAEDQNGELFALGLENGAIYKLTSDSKPINSSFATQLSATGCALASDPKQADAGMIPYDINARLWSDGAVKYRWFALPGNAKIHVRDDGDWEFPIGSVLRKDFYLHDKIIETRLLAHHTDGSWAGYSYEWDDTQSDATMRLNGLSKLIDGQTWTYPSSNQCLMCHTQAANRVLGPETGQMNRNYTYPNIGQLNQLSHYQNLGLFDNAIPAGIPTLADPTNTELTTADRARAYLHANCSHCHRPGGTGNVAIDLRYTTPLAEMNICNIVPALGDLGLGPNARLLAAGDPSLSIISARMKHTDSMRMPVLGSAVVDSFGVGLIDDWITAMTCQ